VAYVFKGTYQILFEGYTVAKGEKVEVETDSLIDHET
jgi:hypothetical protein